MCDGVMVCVCVCVRMFHSELTSAVLPVAHEASEASTAIVFARKCVSQTAE